MTATTNLELSLPRVKSGKVREMFDAGEHFLMVATDRISVFDVVLPTPIPDKGAVLTGVSNFWFENTQHIIGNHAVTHQLSEFPSEARDPGLAGRAVLARKAEMLPIECVVRGYLSGSGWNDYKRSGSVCGYQLPGGLEESAQLPEPLFTPATKAVEGHDINIDVSTAKEIVGNASLVEQAQEVSLALYEFGRAYAAERGVILADTKFEFGLIDGKLTLCDEALTPDSSRYWPADSYATGSTPPSFDKQFVRDFTASTGWDKAPPGPELPQDIVSGTTARYREAYERIVGSSLDAWYERVSS